MDTDVTNRTGTGRRAGLLARQERAWVCGGSTLVLLVGAVVRSVGLLARGRVRLPRSRVGQTLTMQDGEHWRIFRELRLDTTFADTPPGEFRVRFTTRMPVRVNVAFSWLPIMAFMGLPGFVGKTWLVNDTTGAFGGIYRWRTHQDAQRYSGSAALRFMTRRSVPRSVTYCVNTPPSDRLESPWPPATPISRLGDTPSSLVAELPEGKPVTQWWDAPMESVVESTAVTGVVRVSRKDPPAEEAGV